MEFLSKKQYKLTLVLFTLLLFMGTLPIPYTAHSFNYSKVSSSLCLSVEDTGSIVIIDTILEAQTTDSNENVVQLQIYTTGGAPIETIRGCYASRCTYDLSHLSTGTYIAVATLDSNETFGSIIQL